MVVGFGRRKPQNLFYSSMRTTCPVAYVMRVEHAELGLVCLTPARQSFNRWHALLCRGVVKQPGCITSNNCITKCIVHRTKLIASCLMAKKNIEFELVRAMRTPRRLTHSLLRVKPPSTSINCHSLVKRLYRNRDSSLGKYLMQCNETWERYH